MKQSNAEKLTWHHVRIAFVLGWRDIHTRYQRSFLGPLWISVSYLLIVGAISVIYTQILGAKVSEYVPYLAAGYVVWLLITSYIFEMSSALIQSSQYLLNFPGPASTYFLRTIVRNLLVFLHNVPVFILISLFFDWQPNWSSLLLLPALLVVMTVLYPWGAVLGLLALKFRDIPIALGPLFQILFFVTPVMWEVKDVSGSVADFVSLMPLNYLLDLIRSPLLGFVPSPSSWVVALVFGTFGFLFMGFTFSRNRAKLELWL